MMRVPGHPSPRGFAPLQQETELEALARYDLFPFFANRALSQVGAHSMGFTGKAVPPVLLMMGPPPAFVPMFSLLFRRGTYL